MITIRLDDGEVTAAFGRAAAALGDLTPLMQEVGEYLLLSTGERFKAGKAPDGTIWAPKKPSTMAAQARRGDRPDPRPLFWRGTLSSTIGMRAGPASVEVGSNRVYAAMMQFGGTRARFPRLWGDIPARPFLGLAAADREEVLDIVAGWLEGALRPGP